MSFSATAQGSRPQDGSRQEQGETYEEEALHSVSSISGNPLRLGQKASGYQYESSPYRGQDYSIDHGHTIADEALDTSLSKSGTFGSLSLPPLNRGFTLLQSQITSPKCL